MDPANLPATCFALLSLGFVGGMDSVHRVKCLRWLKRLQRSDGSFGELITKGGVVEGGRDMRLCYVATSIEWMLRGYEDIPEIENIDVESLVGHIKAGQVGYLIVRRTNAYKDRPLMGASQSLCNLKHMVSFPIMQLGTYTDKLKAGYTYCAIASLSLLNRLPGSSDINEDPEKSSGLTNLSATIRWLVSRQLQYENMDEDSEDEDAQFQKRPDALAGIYANIEPSLDNLSIQENMFIGFNGRTNKRADTCYAFWVGGSLAVRTPLDPNSSSPTDDH